MKRKKKKVAATQRRVSVLGTMKSPDSSGTGLEQNVRTSVRKLGLSYRSGVLQQDNGPEHSKMAKSRAFRYFSEH